MSMRRQLLRVQRPVKMTRQPVRRSASTKQPAQTGSASGSSYSGQSTGTIDSMSIGQSVKVKTGYISLTGNHGLEAGPDNAISPLGAWRGTHGVVVLTRYDRVLVGLKAGFSRQPSEYWVRRSGFWRIFEPA